MSIFNGWHLPFLIFPYLPFQKNETLESWHNWLLSNWSRLLNWKRPGTQSHSFKLFKRFLRIVALVYIYQLTKFGDLMSCDSKYIFKIALCFMYQYSSWRLDLVNHVMFENTKTLIFWERNITFLQNKKILNLCLRWYIFRSYLFLAKVTFNHNFFAICYFQFVFTISLLYIINFILFGADVIMLPIFVTESFAHWFLSSFLTWRPISRSLN